MLRGWNNLRTTIKFLQGFQKQRSITHISNVQDICICFYTLATHWRSINTDGLESFQFTKCGTKHNSLTHYLITVICNAVTLTPPLLHCTELIRKNKVLRAKATWQKLGTVIHIHFNWIWSLDGGLLWAVWWDVMWSTVIITVKTDNHWGTQCHLMFPQLSWKRSHHICLTGRRMISQDHSWCPPLGRINVLSSVITKSLYKLNV